MTATADLLQARLDAQSGLFISAHERMYRDLKRADRKATINGLGGFAVGVVVASIGWWING